MRKELDKIIDSFKKEKFLVEGRHLVLEAYKTGFLDELLLEENELLPLDVMTNYMTNNVISQTFFIFVKIFL